MYIYNKYHMFSFFNWFTSTPKVEEVTPSTPLTPLTPLPPKVHILSNTEFTTIMNRLHQLEEIVTQNHYVAQPIPITKTDETKLPSLPSSPRSKAFQQELIEKIFKIRCDMVSHGFDRQEFNQLGGT